MMKRPLITGLALVTMAGAAQGATLSNLIAHWTFDDAAPTSLADSSTAGNNHAGTSGGTGITALQPGVIGTSFEFGDTSTNNFPKDAHDPINIANVGDLGGATVSYGGWIKRGGDLNSINETFFEMDGGAEAEYDIRENNNRSFRANAPLWDGDNRVLSGDNSADNQWRHVMAVFSSTSKNDPSGTLKLYIDGVLVDTSTNGIPNHSGNGPQLEPRTVTLARFTGNTGGQGDFEAFLDDWAVLDVALTDAEVLAIYNGGQNGQSIAQVVPEPGSLALMGIGGLLITRRRRG